MACGAPMKEQRGDFDYSSLSGLPVVLSGVTIARCARCGEEEVEIPRIEGLHLLLARALMRKPAPLTPGEFRFLRTWLGHSSVDFAAIVGVRPETVSRWEHGGRSIPPTADRLLRLIVAAREPRDDYAEEDMLSVGTEAAGSEQFRARVRRSGWDLKPAA